MCTDVVLYYSVANSGRGAPGATPTPMKERGGKKVRSSRRNGCRTSWKSFYTIGKNFTFIPKRTVLDYILFDGDSIRKITMWKEFAQGLMSITSDHLHVFAELEINCTQHFLNHQKLQLPAWHRATTDDIERYKTSHDIETTTLLDRDLTSFLRLTHSLPKLSAFSQIPHQEPFPTVVVTHTHVLDGRKKWKTSTQMNQDYVVSGYQTAGPGEWITNRTETTNVQKDNFEISH